MPRKSTRTRYKTKQVYTSAITGTPAWHRAKTLEDGSSTMAWVDYKGMTYTLVPKTRTVFLTPSVWMANDNTKRDGEGWQVFGEPEQSRHSKAARKAAAARKAGKGMTKAEKAALDRMVLRVLRGYHPSGSLPTPSLLALDIFSNHNYGYDDVDDRSDAAFSTTYSQRAATSAVRASLNRLVKQGKVDQMYGTGMRGREAMVYSLAEYD